MNDDSAPHIGITDETMHWNKLHQNQENQHEEENY